MKHLSQFIALLLLSTFFLGCQDHTGIPAEDGKQVRLKRLYVSTATVPGRNYGSYYDFFYDDKGRLNSVPHFTIDKDGTPVMDEHTIIYYDAKGRVDHERTDGMESRTARYGYDSLGRLQNIWIKVDGVTGMSGYHFTNSDNGLPWERLFYVLNAAGDSTTRSRERYQYDANRNLVDLVQTYSSDVTAPFVRKITYNYDNKPNPWLHVPATIFRTTAYLYSQNNPIESTMEETYSPPTTAVYNRTQHFNNKYNNGLLAEAELDQQLVWKYEYETY